MSKGKADGEKQGGFARWRERRKRNKLRAGEIGRRVSDARSIDKQRVARRGGGIPPGAM
jgi:hypothetical protein